MISRQRPPSRRPFPHVLILAWAIILSPLWAEDINWDNVVFENGGSWFDEEAWLEGTVPADGQSVATTGCCAQRDIDINNAGVGVNLPNSAIRFDTKANLFDSDGDDDALVAATIAFNGSGGEEVDVDVPVIAPMVTSNRHGACFNVSPTLDTLLAVGTHQQHWKFNASPTSPITLIRLADTDQRGTHQHDDDFTVNADLSVATLEHVWSRLNVGPGATLRIGTYQLTMTGYKILNELNLEGDIVADAFLLDGINQRSGTWGAVGSGADTEVPWIEGSGLLRVIPSEPSFRITEIRRLKGDQIRLTWESLPGTSYRVFWGPDLSDLLASIEVDFLALDGETTSAVIDSPAPGTRRLFFRVGAITK